MNDEHDHRAARRTRRRGSTGWTNETRGVMTSPSREETERSMPSSRTTRIFTYGTLLRGELNHALLAGSRLVGPARTEPRFELVSLGPYPSMIVGGETAVVGEIYEVNLETLAALDRLECCPDLYRRVPIRLEDGGEVLAYLMERAQVAGMPRIPGGDWRRRPRTEEHSCAYGS